MTPRTWMTLATASGLAAYLATGFVVIQQDEVGVVRRFGAAARDPLPPGLHWCLPRGMDRVDRVVIEQARTLNVGAPGPAGSPLTQAPDPDNDDFLTGDLNLVSVRAQVQFRVVRPTDYLFSAGSADSALSALGESAVAGSLAVRAIDDVLTGARAEVAEEIRQRIQADADTRRLGVSVRAVRLSRVTPPALVAPAFADASRARGDARQAVTRAEEYHDRALADAKGLARETSDRASARFATLVQTSRGEADRFSKIASEVRKDPQTARKRLYLETLADVLPRFARKVIVAPKHDVDFSVIGTP